MDQRDGADPVARAREMGEAVVEASDAVESTRRIPAPLLACLHGSRLFRMLLPRSVGGDEVAPGVCLMAIEEVARHDASVAWNVFIANAAALIAPYLEPDTARTVFGDPRALIAWGPPNGTRATAVPGGYRVDGTWAFASGCRNATWMGAHCEIVEADGSLRRNDAGRPLMRTFLFPAENAELHDTWHTTGLRGTASDSYTVTDLFVAEAFTGMRADPTLRRESGPLYAFTMQSLYAMGVAGVALGIARAMLSAFVELATRKTPLGQSAMVDSATAQAGVARNEAKLGAARAYLLETLGDIHAQAGATAPIDVADRARVRLASVHAIHAAIAVADHVHKAAGMDAIFPGTPFERRFRDMHTLSQQIQSRDSHYESVGKVLLGVPPTLFL